MPVLAVSLQKGGVGKTATCLNAGVELAHQGARVLLIDSDPQSNLTQALGYDTTIITTSIYEVLLQPQAGVAPALLKTAHGVDLIPATLALAGAELTLANRIGRELLLRTALTTAREQYDYILIDTPPSLGLFTVNALAAADSVLVPLQAHGLAWKALPQLEETIGLVRQLNPRLAISGIVVTMASRTTISTIVAEEARHQYGDTVFQTVIPQATKLVEAPTAGVPIGTYAPESAAAHAYTALATEMKARYGHQKT